jgi:3-phytase
MTDARCLALLLLAAAPALADPAHVRVEAVAETEGSAGDVDDPAIWADGADSLILGTDKTEGGGLMVYGLDGGLRQHLPDGRLNNVDLRPFALGGRPVGLAGATRRDDETVVLYVIEGGAVRRAVPWQHAAIPPGVAADDIYGFAMGAWGGATFVIANFKSGHVVQWRAHEAQGTVALELVRVVRLPSQPEGMVADDAGGWLYVGEEDAGIWRLPLDPASGAAPELVVPIPSPCLPRDDVEGLAVVEGEPRRLIASAQGIHRAAVFVLDGDAPPRCEALVEVAPGAVDGVTETDGLDATATALPGFPGGLLVMMDDQNAGFTTNFKLVPWDAVLDGLAR